MVYGCLFFFFKQKTAYEVRISDWSSDVCSSDLMAFGCLALTAGLSSGLVWQSTQSRVTPYVVEVDRLGEARAVTEAEAGCHPTEPKIAWHLSRFISNGRGRTVDPVRGRQDWREAYDFTTKRGSQCRGDYERGADHLAKIVDRTEGGEVKSGGRG